jgi:hypothetical protein
MDVTQSKAYRALASAHGKMQAERDALAARLREFEAQAPSGDISSTADEQAAPEEPEYEEGAKYVWTGGAFEPVMPPAPQNPNEANYVAQTGWTDRYGDRQQPKRESVSTGWPV